MTSSWYLETIKNGVRYQPRYEIIMFDNLYRITI